MDTKGRSPEQINFTPVPYMCSGQVITELSDSSATYEVQIYKSPIGDFNGPIHCTSIYSSGSDNHYREGDNVKVLITFMFGGSDNRVKDMAPGTEAYIIGNFDDQAIFPRHVINPLLPKANDTIRYFNSRSKAGMAIGDNGHVTIASNGPVYTYYRAGGFGTGKDSNVSYAQNFLKVLSNNQPFSTAREHFGLYTGSSETDESTRLTPDTNYVIRRSFVPQTKGLSNWVSTCEGAFTPFMGPNNSNTKINPSRDTLFHKVINAGFSRVTIESGEAGDGFMMLRVDKVISGEKYLDIGPGIITGVLGNMFKMKIGDDGAFSLTGGSKGIPAANFNGFKVSGDAQGNLTLQASKKLVLTTGDGEEEINSITVSTDGAIDVKTTAGFTVNGEPVVHKAFLDWFIQNMPAMFVCAPPGSPAVPNPAALATLLAQSPLPSVSMGMTTTGVPAPLPGLIVEPDPYKTV